MDGKTTWKQYFLGPGDSTWMPWKAFFSRGASLFLPPVLGLWGSRMDQDMPGRYKANQPDGVN